MDGQTSIGPAEPRPEAKSDKADKAIAPGVDAQAANDADMRRGIAGAEAKPFSKTPARAQSEEPAGKRQGSDGAASPERRGDPNSQNPNARSDLVTERRDPGRHGGGGNPAWKPSR